MNSNNMRELARRLELRAAAVTENVDDSEDLLLVNRRLAEGRAYAGFAAELNKLLDEENLEFDPYIPTDEGY